MTAYKISICGTDPDDVWELIAMDDQEKREMIENLQANKWATIDDPIYVAGFNHTTKTQYYSEPDLETIYINTDNIQAIRVTGLIDWTLEKGKS